MKIVSSAHASVLAAVFAIALTPSVLATNEVSWSAEETPVHDRLSRLRDVPDDQRGSVTSQLAKQIHELPATSNKLLLAVSLAGYSTEGDFGEGPIQAVADTLSAALGEEIPLSVPSAENPPVSTQQTRLRTYSYRTLATLVMYEHITTPLAEDEHLRDAMQKLRALDERRSQLDFILKDMDGKEWTLSQLRGKVVLLNFWATWCPPCRKEIPDLAALQQRFAGKGLVILAVTDESKEKVAPFVARLGIPYPLLLDPGHTFMTSYGVREIPKTFVYDVNGKIVAQAIDARSSRQFLEMLASAGIR